MKITINLALFFAVAFLGLTGCSKEKKIERALLKKDGIWDVVSFNNDNTIDYPTFVFYKNGEFEFEPEIGTLTKTGTWMNTDDDIVITLDQSGLNNNHIYVLKIIEESKDEMTLQRKRWYVDMGSWTYDDTYQIKRRK